MAVFGRPSVGMLLLITLGPIGGQILARFKEQVSAFVGKEIAKVELVTSLDLWHSAVILSLILIQKHQN